MEEDPLAMADYQLIGDGFGYHSYGSQANPNAQSQGSSGQATGPPQPPVPGSMMPGSLASATGQPSYHHMSGHGVHHPPPPSRYMPGGPGDPTKGLGHSQYGSPYGPSAGQAPPPQMPPGIRGQYPPGPASYPSMVDYPAPGHLGGHSSSGQGVPGYPSRVAPQFTDQRVPPSGLTAPRAPAPIHPMSSHQSYPGGYGSSPAPGYGHPHAASSDPWSHHQAAAQGSQHLPHQSRPPYSTYPGSSNIRSSGAQGFPGQGPDQYGSAMHGLPPSRPNFYPGTTGPGATSSSGSHSIPNEMSALSSSPYPPPPHASSAPSFGPPPPSSRVQPPSGSSQRQQPSQPQPQAPPPNQASPYGPSPFGPSATGPASASATPSGPRFPQQYPASGYGQAAPFSDATGQSRLSPYGLQQPGVGPNSPGYRAPSFPGSVSQMSPRRPTPTPPAGSPMPPTSRTPDRVVSATTVSVTQSQSSNYPSPSASSQQQLNTSGANATSASVVSPSGPTSGGPPAPSNSLAQLEQMVVGGNTLPPSNKTAVSAPSSDFYSPLSGPSPSGPASSQGVYSHFPSPNSSSSHQMSQSSQQQPNYYYQQQQQQSQSSVSWPGSQQGQPPSTAAASSVSGNSSVPYSPASQQGQNTPQSNTSLRSPQQPASSASNSSAKSPLNSQFSLYDSNQFNSPSSDSYGNKATDPNGSLLSTLPSMSKPPGSQGQASVYDQSSSSFGSPAPGQQQQQQPPTPQQAQPQQSTSESDQSTDASGSKDERKDGESAFSQPDSRPQPSPSSNFYATMRSDSSSGQSDQSLTGGLKKPGTPNSQSAQRPGSSSSMSHEGYMQRPPQGPYGHPSDPNQQYMNTQMYPPPPPPQQSSGQSQSFGQMSHYPSSYGDSMNYDMSSEMGNQMSSYGGQPDQRSMYDQSGYGHAPPGMDNMVGSDQGQMGDYSGEMGDMSSMQYQPSPYDEPFSSEPPTKKKGKGRPKKDPSEPKKEKKPRQPRTPKAPRGRGRGGRGAAMGDRMPPPPNEYGAPEGPYGMPPGHPDMYQMQGPPPGHPGHMGPMHTQAPHDSFRPPAPGMMQSPGVHPGMAPQGPQGPPPPSMEPQAPGMGPPPMQQPGQPSMHLEVNPFDRLGQPPVPVPGQSMLPPSIPPMDATPQQQPTAPTTVPTSATSTEVPPDHSASDVMGRVASSTDFRVDLTTDPPPDHLPQQQQQSMSHIQPASTLQQQQSQQQQQQQPLQQQAPPQAQPIPQPPSVTLPVVSLSMDSVVCNESQSTGQSIGDEEHTKSTAVTESVSTIADETSQSMSSMSQEAPSIFMPPPPMTEESASHHQPDLSDLNSSLPPPSTMDDSSTVPLGGLEDSCKLVVNESLEQTSTPKRKSKKRKTKEEKEAEAAAAGSESTEKKPKKPKRQSGKKKKDAETPNESGIGGDMDTSLTNAADAPVSSTIATDQSLVTGDSSTVFDEATQEGDTTLATGDSSIAESPSKGGKGKGKGKSTVAKPKKPKLKDGKSPSKKKLPKIALAKFKGKRKKKLGSSNSDLEKTPPPSPDETESGIQKRRSGRVTKRTKYTDDIDLDLSDGEGKGNKDDPDKAAEPAPVNAVPVDDTMVVEKIMCSRMGTRELEPENEEEEAKFNGKPPTVEVEEFYVKYKNLSYLHCDWRTEDELERGDKRIAQKIKRFKMKKDNNTSFDFLDDEPFNPDYCEVDRILDVNIVEELIPDDSAAPVQKETTSKPSESTATSSATNTTTTSPSTPPTSTSTDENLAGEPVQSTESSQEANPPPASDGESATNNKDDSKSQPDATASLSSSSSSSPTTAAPASNEDEGKDGQDKVVKSETQETNESEKPSESDSTEEKADTKTESMETSTTETPETTEKTVKTTETATSEESTATKSEESVENKPESSDTVKCEKAAIDTRPKKVKISRHYLVKWQALPYEESTWELEDDLNPEKIAQFWKFRDPPPKEKIKFKKRPKASEWKKLDASPEYKGGHGLREYQLEGLNWLTFCWYNNRNCILADEMGLGKTIQSLTFVNEMVNYGIHSPFLIIAPLSTIGNWQREFDTWTDLNVITYHGSSASRNMIQEYEMYYKNEKGERMEGIYKFQVMITTFEIILTDCIELGEINWRACIIDEAHRLKNRNCKLLEGLRCLKIEHRVLLTGTPLQNNVAELFSLLNFLEPQQFASPEQFMLDFGDLKTEEQVEKLQAILKPMMLRRLKEDVEKSLAPKEETIVEVELTNIQKKYYRAILERNFQFLSKGGTYANMPNLMNTMMELRKCCIHPFLINSAEEQILAEYKQQHGESGESQLKCMVQASGKLVLIDKLLPRLRADGHRVLIFSQMVRCLDILEDYVIQKKYPFERIDGRVRGNLRQAAIDRFSKPGSDRFVFLLCTRAGGLGINLTAADTVIIFDSDWNPQNDLQAQARCHRIGQQKHVKVYRLICRNTYEREMFDKASLKLGLDKAVLQSMNTSKTMGDGGAPLSKKEVEELLRKGAYGAVMDDDNAGDKFCEEDIDQILTRRTQVITIESGEKGSTFSKASFASSENADIEIDDPNFWEKWAKKANIDTEEMTGKNELIVQEPRRRTQTKRFGQDDGVMDISDVDSSDDDEDNVSGRTRGGRGRPLRGRKNKKGRGGGYDRERDEDYMEEFGPGNWARAECFKTEMGLLTYGWGRWEEILSSGNYRRRLTPEDIESIARVILLFSLQNYKGDEKIKLFIYDLITPVDPKNPTKGVTGGRNSPTGRGRKGRKSKKTVAEELSTSDWASSDQYNPELLLVDDQYRKHLVRHSNKLLLRVKMLYYLSAEVIGDLRDEVLRNVAVKEIPIPPPIADCDPPCPWWDEEADKSLLIGVFKHGYDKYNAIRSDPALCFYHKCGPPDGAALEAEIQNDDDLGRLDEDEEGDGPATPASTKTASAAAAATTTAAAGEADGASGKTATETEKTTEGQEAGENAASTAADQDVGKLLFPSRTDMNQRLRRIIAAYQRHSKRQEIRMAQQARHQLRLEKLERFEAAIKERELKKREQAQRKWSRREEADFYRVVSSYGVEYDRITNVFDWNKFRQFSRLEKKHDETLTEYFKAFYAMCKRVTGRRLTEEEENLAISVDPISEERASRCLARIDLLSKIREEILQLPDLDERLQLCQPSIDLPDWWVCGKHDRDLLIGAAKYGLNRLDLNVMHDPDLSFKDIVKQAELDAKNSSNSDSTSKEEKASTDDAIEKGTTPTTATASSTAGEEGTTEDAPSKDDEKTPDESEQPVEKNKAETTSKGDDEDVPDDEEKETSVETNGKEKDQDDKVEKVEETESTKETSTEENASANGSDVKEGKNENETASPVVKSSEKSEKEDGENDKEEEDSAIESGEVIKKSDETQNGSIESPVDEKPAVNGDAAPEELKTEKSSISSPKAEEDESIKPVQNGEINGHDEEMKCEPSDESKVPVSNSDSTGTPVVKDETKADSSKESEESNKAETEVKSTENPALSAPVAPVKALRWPKDRVLQMRLEQIVYCIEKNEWPSVRHTFFSTLSGPMGSTPSIATADSSPRAVSPGSLSSVSREPTPHPTPDHTPRRDSMSPLQDYIFDNSADSMRRRKRRRRTRVDTEPDRTAKLRNLLHQGIDPPGHSYQQQLHQAATAAQQAAAAAAATASAAASATTTKSKMPSAQSLLNHSAASFLPPNFFNSLPFMNLRSDIRNELLSDENTASLLFSSLGLNPRQTSAAVANMKAAMAASAGSKHGSGHSSSSSSSSASAPPPAHQNSSSRRNAPIDTLDLRFKQSSNVLPAPPVPAHKVPKEQSSKATRQTSASPVSVLDLSGALAKPRGRGSLPSGLTAPPPAAHSSSASGGSSGRKPEKRIGSKLDAIALNLQAKKMMQEKTEPRETDFLAEIAQKSERKKEQSGFGALSSLQQSLGKGSKSSTSNPPAAHASASSGVSSATSKAIGDLFGKMPFDAAALAKGGDASAFLEKANLIKQNLTKFIQEHPDFFAQHPDLAATAAAAMQCGLPVASTSSSLPANTEILELPESRRRGRRPKVDTGHSDVSPSLSQSSSSTSSSSFTPNSINFDETVPVVHRLTNKRLSGPKAPQLRNVVEWLKANPMYEIDPKWSQQLAAATRDKSSSFKVPASVPQAASQVAAHSSGMRTRTSDRHSKGELTPSPSSSSSSSSKGRTTAASLLAQAHQAQQVVSPSSSSSSFPGLPAGLNPAALAGLNPSLISAFAPQMKMFMDNVASASASSSKTATSSASSNSTSSSSSSSSNNPLNPFFPFANLAGMTGLSNPLLGFPGFNLPGFPSPNSLGAFGEETTRKSKDSSKGQHNDSSSSRGVSSNEKTRGDRSSKSNSGGGGSSSAAANLFGTGSGSLNSQLPFLYPGMNPNLFYPGLAGLGSFSGLPNANAAFASLQSGLMNGLGNLTGASGLPGSTSNTSKSNKSAASNINASNATASSSSASSASKSRSSGAPSGLSLSTASSLLSSTGIHPSSAAAAAAMGDSDDESLKSLMGHEDDDDDLNGDLDDLPEKDDSDSDYDARPKKKSAPSKGKSSNTSSSKSRANTGQSSAPSKAKS